MKNQYYIITLLCFCSLLINAQITPSNMVVKMGRGINLGNTLSATVEGNWQPAVVESYFDDVNTVGYKTVRIPIDFFGTRTSGDTSVYSKLENTTGLYNGSSTDYVVSSTYLDRVEEVIDWSLERGLVTILDFHGKTLKDEFIHTYSTDEDYADIFTHPTSAKRAADYDKFKSIWNQIAERFKNHSYDLLFEIINEPYFEMSKDEMDVLNTDLISVIRNTGANNNDRNIIITGGALNSYRAPQQIASSVINSDDNLIATFHYYLPFKFTSSAKEQYTQDSWGTSDDKATVDSNFLEVKTWSATNNIPVLLGEYGADNEVGYDYDSNEFGSFGGPDRQSRIDYHRYITDKAIESGFCTTVWEAGHKSDKTIYLVNHPARWVTEIRNATLSIDCFNSTLINNADVECGTSADWSLYVNTGAGAVAAIEDSSEAEAYTGSKAVKLNTTTAGSSIGHIVLKNIAITDTDFLDKTLKFGVFAKGTNTVTAQSFKMRLKLTDQSDQVSYMASDLFQLSTDSYSLFEYEKTLNENYKKVEFQVICGNTQGTVYLDDFSSSIISNETLSTREIDASLIDVENIDDTYTITSDLKIKEVKLYAISGAVIKKTTNNTIDTSKLKTGIYFFKVEFKNGKYYSNKILIN